MAPAHTRNVQGWAVQGDLKVNKPFVAPGDTLYLQGAYGDAAHIYASHTETAALESSTPGDVDLALRRGFHGSVIVS